MKVTKVTLETQVAYDGTTMSLKEAIAKIPGEDGWWKSYSQEVFEKKAIELVEAGFSAEKALWFLSEVYMAVADCYGG